MKRFRKDIADRHVTAPAASPCLCPWGCGVRCNYVPTRSTRVGDFCWRCPTCGRAWQRLFGHENEPRGRGRFKDCGVRDVYQMPTPVHLGPY